MKLKTQLLILLLGLSSQIFSQSEGIITYKETVKFELELDGMSDEMKSMIPESQSVQKELLFKKDESLYRNKKGEALEGMDLKSDDGSFHIKIMVDDTEDIYYKSFPDQKKIHQTGMMGKSFVIKDDLPKHKWKITNEKIKFLGYECQKAVVEDEDNFIVAWFTTQIPVTAGPGGLHGLPGLILMASFDDGEREIQAQEVKLNALDKKAIVIPSEGKKVSQEQFEKIREEKEREMEEMYGGNRVIRERR